MDKYTYNIKAEKIQKLVKKGDFEAAVKIADTIDWEEVRSVRLLTITAAAYENTRDYKSAIELLQMAYEESAVGKRILYKLTGLAIAEGDVDLAQHYYEMYLQEASDDNGRYLLRYLLAELKKEPLDKRIAILETYRKYEFEEEWALRLAQMYDEAGMGNECVKLCDEIILWFGVGDYVDEAMALKEKHAPLSDEQREHRDNKEFYEQRYQELVDEYNSREAAFLKRESEKDEEETAAQKAEAAWSRQILLVESENLEDAVPKALERLALYYRAKGLPMGRLTRISAERFNQVGFEGAREHLKGKDLLIDDASSLSEELLSDIVHSVKYEQNPQIFVLTDKPEQLAYLDTRLGEYVEKDVTMPQINMSEPPAESVLMHVSEAMDEAEEAEIPEISEPSEVAEEAEEKREEKGESLPELNPEEEIPEMLLNIPASVWDAASEPQEEAEKEETEETEETAEPAEETKDESEEAKEPPFRPDVDEAVQWTLDDFLKDQDETPAQENAGEEATSEGEESSEEAFWKPFLGNFEPLDEEKKQVAPQAEQPVEAPAEAEEEGPEATKKVPIADIRAALDQAAREEAEAAALAAAVTPEPIKEAEPPAELSGETKTVQKLSTATGALSAVGMSEEAFVEYAKNYLSSIDCVLDDVGELALQNAAENRVEAGILLTKEEAENMIEDAADLAEKKGGIFAKRYDKEGCLILKSKYIK